MKITYLTHATLLIETNGVKILSDPWLFGPAYCEQWYQFPPAPEAAAALLHDVDYVLLTHGHEDHLHHPTLTKINKNAHVYFPYSWYDGAKDYFQSLGFVHFTEAFNEKKYRLAPDLYVTYLANNLDNLFVLEDGKRVLVNINDALHSAPKGVIKYFTEKIKKQWPAIDYLWCGYGGASYYPNTIKAPGKNDREVGLIREQFFADNFCTIAQALDATYSIPFACDFVLLDESLQWINEVRFPRTVIPAYFQEYFNSNAVHTSIKVLYAGDVVKDDQFVLTSPYHEFSATPINELVKQVYADAIEQKKNTISLSHASFLALVEKVEQHVEEKAFIVPPAKATLLTFTLQITDAPDEDLIEINLNPAAGTKKVTLVPARSDKHVLLLKVKSESLLYSITKEWGGDALIIGYACQLEVFDTKTIVQELDNYAIQLLTRYPNTKAYIKKNPVRALHYLVRDEFKRKAFLQKLLYKKEADASIDPLLKDNELWLNRSNCEICKKCNLPIMDNKLGNQF